MWRQIAVLGLATGLIAGCQREPKPYAGMVGVVEGFFGEPWSHQDRLDMLDFMGEHGLTAYFYAPKADPLHRRRWREPYGAESLARFRQLAARAKRNQVRFYFAISPGTSIEYSEDGESAALEEKIAAMAGIGIEHFALFFDDVPPVLSKKDGTVFADLAEAQALLVNRIAAFLGGRGLSELVICPTIFTDAWRNRDYIVKLGQQVDPSVTFLWTGPDVVSPQVTVAEAAEWTRLAGRKPLLWDNFPVNDFEPWRLFLGGLSHREPGLAEATAGIILNPMNQAHASMIALSTLPDFVHNPRSYDPEASARAGIKALFGAEAALHLDPFLEVYGQPLWEDNVFEPLFVPANEIPLERIRTQLDRLERSLRTLKGSAFASNRPVEAWVAEVEPIVRRTAVRLSDLEQSDRYRREGDRLLYNDAADRYRAQPVSRSIRVDGQLSEWGGSRWVELLSRGAESFDSRAEVALREQAGDLYLGLRVTDHEIESDSGIAVGNGDHSGLAIARRDPETGEAYCELFLLPPDSKRDAVFHGEVRYTGFMQRMMREKEDLIVDPFYASILEAPIAEAERPTVTVASRRVPAGWSAEFRLTGLGSGEPVRLALFTVDRDGNRRRFYSLSSRNYPLNPNTFATISY